MGASDHPRLGSLVVALRPRAECLFRFDSARSVHAALLRRIEQFNPRLSHTLHEAPSGSHDVVRPWTIANLQGRFEQRPGGWLALPTRVYVTRVTALTADVLLAVERAVGEMELERVPFEVVDVFWQRATTYRQLAHDAAMGDRLDLVWLSPTAFHTGRIGELSPALCLASYLRRWNTFADADLRLSEAPLLKYARERISTIDTSLKPASARPGPFRLRGNTGHTTWVGHVEPAELLGQVCLLAAYAFYAGTGVKTTLGMGQTISGMDAASAFTSLEQMLTDRF